MEKRPSFTRSRPSRPRRATKRIVAPTPPARTKPAPSALAAMSGSLPRRFVASPMPARRSSTAPASSSRSVAMSRRTSSVERLSASAIANRLRRQLGFPNRLLRNRRRAPLDHAQPGEQKDDGEQGQDPEDDQERSPHGQDERERCGSSRKPEAQGEEPEDCRGDRHADPDTKRGNLALDLE